MKTPDQPPRRESDALSPGNGKKLSYLSVCSGIEAASVAWEPFGFRPVAFSEIESFPSAVLAQRYPDVPNLGDMTQYEQWNIPSIDILAGGTPCQSFSVAGKRGGLSDERGNLCLTFCQMADHFGPAWVLWENVPGVLSSVDMRSDACWENYAALVPPSNRQQNGNTGLAAWWPGLKEPWHGGSWTPNGTEYPNAADVSLSLLQEVLETGPLPTRYYLSETACRGILRRAEKRGKKLPPALERALKARIGTAAPIPPSEPSPPASA